MSSSNEPISHANASYRAQNLVGMEWSNVEYKRGDFSQSQLHQTHFEHVSFQETEFHAAIVRQANWHHCRFEQCTGRFIEMEQSTLSGNHFVHATFEDGSFYEVQFTDTVWTDCSLSGSDLRYSSFRNAQLKNVNFNNCDLAHVDFTGCNLDDVSCYNARITNAIGLSDEMREKMLAGGAYEGLPPTLNKLRKKGIGFRRDLGSKIETLKKKITPSTWLDTAKITEQVRSTFQEWKEERARQQAELQKQEEAWRQEQEARRLKGIEERKRREEQRRLEKEAQKAERERLLERKKQEQGIQELLQSQQKERQTLQQDIQAFFTNLESADRLPEHLQELNSQSTELYQQTEQALETETALRNELKDSPLDADIQERLESQIQETQQLAQRAMDAQQEYFDKLQAWKQTEAQLLEQLQQEALLRSNQILLERRASLDAEQDTIDTLNRQNMLRAELEYERKLIETEIQSLSESTSDNTMLELQSLDTESTTPIVSTLDKTLPDSEQATDQDKIDDSEDYRSLFNRVYSWFSVQAAEENTVLEDIEGTEDTEPTELDSATEPSISTDIAEGPTNETFEGQEDKLVSSAKLQQVSEISIHAISKQLHAEMEIIQQNLQDDDEPLRVSPNTLQDLRAIQEQSIKDILSTTLTTESLSKQELQDLQTTLITRSLVSFQEQIEKEKRLEQAKLTQQQVEQEKQENRKREEQALLDKRRQEREEEQAKKAAIEAQRAAELEQAHKAQLQAIIDKRYQNFEKTQKATVTETEETFVDSFEFERSGKAIQQVQRLALNKSIEALLEAEADKERREQEQAEQQRLAEERQRQKEARQREQLEAQQRKKEHREALRQQAEEAKAQAVAKAQKERDRKRLEQAEAEERQRLEQEQKIQERKERQRQTEEAKEQKRQEKLAKRKAREEEKAKEAERLAQERELRRLEALEKEQQAKIERKKERLSSLKNQLLEEARRQEYQELSAQIEADIETQQSQSLERQRKQEAFLEQVRAEQERRANDPLLKEQAQQRELFARKQQRLERLQEREREVQAALLELQVAYEKENISVEPNDFSVQIQRPLQQRWYQFTDKISTQSPALARNLDELKERLEELYLSRQAQATFEREQQKRQAASALEAKRQQEHQARLQRLAEIRAKEEQREARLLDEAERKARQQTEANRRRERLAMKAEERHRIHRTEASSFNEPMDLFQQDLRGGNHVAARWIDSNASRALLSGIKLEAANLINSNFTLAFLDYASLNGATLDQAVLNKSNLQGINLYEASLRQTQMRLSRLYDADLRFADVRQAKWENVDCTGSKAQSAIFDGAVCVGCTFVEMSLRTASFEGADLRDSNFHRSDLHNAKFHNATVTNTDFRGSQGLTSEQLQNLEQRGALVDLQDAVDRYGTWGAPQLQVALVLFALGVGSILLTQVLDGQNADLESLEAQAQEMREQDAGLASEQYEKLAEQSQILDEQVQYYIESAILAEQNGDVQRSEVLFNKALKAADLNTELNTKVGLRFAQFLLTHSQPDKALERLKPLMTYQSLSTFQRAKLIFYTEQSCEIVQCKAEEELASLYTSMEALPEVQADLHMALSDLRLQHGQSDKALAELQQAEQLPISDGLALRLIESKARAHDRLGNLNEAISAYEQLQQQAEPNSQTTQTATLALADLWRRIGNIEKAMTLLEGLTESAKADGRLRSRSLLIQGRLLEEQDDISTAADKYKEVLNISEVEPETQEEARVSLARLLLQNDAESVGDLPPEILAQAKLGEARSILDQGEFEEALELYSSIIGRKSGDSEAKDSDKDDGIRRAAQSGMAEALSNLGKHQEANEIWEGLLRERLDPVESQHIEVLLAYSKLQANDIEGARLAFESLQQSNDGIIRYQGLMGSAQASVLAGELERAKDAYQRILQTQPSEEIQIQIWQELAQIAQEQNAIEDVLLAWQNILRFGVDDEALRSEAHTSIALALAQMDRLDEAISECELNLSTPEAQLQCATILEMAGDDRAPDRYQVIVNNERISDALRSEAALGFARLSSPAERSDVCQVGLGLSQIDPIVELQLIQLYLETPSISDEEINTWQTRQQSLAQASPTVLVQYLMERTSQLRIDGKFDDAIRTMEQGLTGLPSEFSAPLTLELADMLVENEQPAQSIPHYQSLLEQDTESRLVRSGLARAYMMTEQWQDARTVLSGISTQAVTGSEIQMLMEVNQASPSAEGLELANSWATQASNPDVQWEALMSQAHSALGDDNLEQAMALFDEASTVGIEPRQKQWAILGKAQVHMTIGEFDVAVDALDSIEQTDDEEVNAQTHIQKAKALLSNEQLTEALDSLNGYTASELGPGWDMSVEELRTQIYTALEQFDNAHQTLVAIQERWPDEEQVQIPSAIAKIHVLQQEGKSTDAQTLAQRSLQQVQDPVYKDQLDELLASLQ